MGFPDAAPHEARVPGVGLGSVDGRQFPRANFDSNLTVVDDHPRSWELIQTPEEEPASPTAVECFSEVSTPILWKREKQPSQPFL